VRTGGPVSSRLPRCMSADGWAGVVRLPAAARWGEGRSGHGGQLVVSLRRAWWSDPCSGYAVSSLCGCTLLHQYQQNRRPVGIPGQCATSWTSTAAAAAGCEDVKEIAGFVNLSYSGLVLLTKEHVSW
jgi:hypothetical protein